MLASALGQKAGKALFVQDYSYSARPYANIMMAKSAVMDMAAEATAAPTLEFEKIKIEHSVMVRFVLELFFNRVLRERLVPGRYVAAANR